jgi:hypothetical protein
METQFAYWEAGTELLRKNFALQRADLLRLTSFRHAD